MSDRRPENPKLNRRQHGGPVHVEADVTDADREAVQRMFANSPADLIAELRREVESGTIKGERRWLCEYPEFGDDNCMVDHNPAEAWQPRKHTQCGWHLVIKIGDSE